MKALALGAIAALASLVPATAWAVEGFATANVNMRSGPSTRYPAVTVIPVGTSVEIHGCLSDVPWCDVSFYNGRGWVAGRYVQAEYRQNRVYVEPNYYDNLGIPTVTFELGTYWDRNYRNRNFYRERDYWRRGHDGDRVRDRDRRPRDNNYERPRRDNNYERPRRNNDDISIGRPRRGDNDNNVERPRRDRDRDRIDNRRGDSDRDIRNRENRREQERNRAERRDRDNDRNQFRNDHRRNDERRNSDRRRDSDNRDKVDNNRGRDGGNNDRGRRCRPGSENCT
ncbi:SH3 domain-containing protein [Pararhizobium sp. O133]|uniref:SH3 domain-containing protein n=1 Tax=Pararhizobium sp. O133 TaxID=3449278 RepID=UPI003F6867EF